MTESLWGVIVGGAIGLTGALAGNIILAKSQAKQNLKQLAFEVGLREWEFNHEHAKALHEKGSPVKYAINPPWHFVYVNYRYAECISKGKVTLKQMQRIMEESKEISKTLKNIDNKM
jgi:hypothetical protein